MTQDLDKLAGQLLGSKLAELSERERRIVEQAVAHKTISTDINETLAGESGFGGRLSDHIAAFGGSWNFIMLFGAGLAVWALLNSELLPRPQVFDPYPFVFLNLILSMLAAIQAPVILMSQNRQAQKDRLVASHDYEVNLKAEIEIMALHEKMDAMRESELLAILEKQQRQLELMERILAKLGPAARGKAKA